MQPVADRLKFLDVPPRAAAFIVTVYGDLVEPRGGVLWMGSLIGLCAEVGISESLVRTAVSRLVAAGRLEGARHGRRSFYRLTPAARAEIRTAAEVIFAAPEATVPPTGWLWLVAPGPASTDKLATAGFAEVGPNLWLGPDRSGAGAPAAGGTAMRAATVAGARALPRFAAAHWALATHADRYREVIDAFGPLAASAEEDLDPRAALTARLCLTHAFRRALLGDPGLPADALPADWPGGAARKLFAGLYRQLSPAAEAHLARTCRGAEGPLPAATAVTRVRLERLARWSPGFDLDHASS